MTDDAMRCALWANELLRLDRLGPNSSGYVLTEVLPDGLAPRLAAAMSVPVSEVLDRLGRGSHAFAAWDWPDDVAAYLWVSTGRERADPLRMDLRFAPDECYGWNAGTLPQHRSHGLFTALLRYAGWRMAREGYLWMWGGILDSNLASQRANARAGFRPILRVTANLEPPPTRIECCPADYADEVLVERALRVLAIPATSQNGSVAAEMLPARWAG